MFAAHLARTLKFSSIKQYLNAVRLEHLERGLPNPLLDNFQLSCTLKGIRRALGDKAHRKLPITPELLRAILRKLDLSSPLHAAFWAACLLMFYTLLRRSNALFDPLQAAAGRFLKRGDVFRTAEGIAVQVTWSKTNQFGARVMTIPLVSSPGNPLCPVQAYALALIRSPSPDRALPAFSYLADGILIPLTPEVFIKQLRSALSDAVDNTADYAGHSFRRGGAVGAFSCGVDVESIRMLGDWRSDCYKIYLESLPKGLQETTKRMIPPVH